MTTLSLDYVGQHWPFGGDLAYLTHANGEQARIYVDDVGETWVDIRRIPEGGWFHSERVRAFRASNGAAGAERDLACQGYTEIRRAQYAHRVRER